MSVVNRINDWTDAPATRDPRRAYRVVDQFEAELADYTGAPYAVAVDSCTNAIRLALEYRIATGTLVATRPVEMPRRTYVGVLQAVRNAGLTIRWRDQDWQTGVPLYRLDPLNVVDAARHFSQAMYSWDAKGWPTLKDTLTCLSFHAAKQLPLGRGGAILTDNQEAADWLKRARTDGRAPGDTAPYATFPGHHMYMPPDTAARGLWILSRWNDNDYSPPPLPPDNYPDLSLL